MSEEQEQMDYEAHNAKIALDLNKAQQEIERLEEREREAMLKTNETRTYLSYANKRNAELQAENEQLRAVGEAAWQVPYPTIELKQALAELDKL